MRSIKQTGVVLAFLCLVTALMLVPALADDPEENEITDQTEITAEESGEDTTEDEDPVEIPEDKWEFQDGYWFYYVGGEAATGLKEIGGKTYYFDENGRMMTGWQEIDGEWFFFSGSGAMARGWLQRGSNWYFLKDSGAMAISWEKINGKWYYFDENGRMTTGWQYVDGEWYFLNDSGAMVRGWMQRGGKWYFLKTSGAMAVSWEKIDGKWYYFDENGRMQTGWQYVDGEWYYLNDSGAMAKGWIKLKDKWYFLKSSGAMATGWEKTDGKWYFFDENGVMAAKEWREGYWLDQDGVWRYPHKGSWQENSKGKWFEDTSGVFPKSTVVKIDGIRYYFNAKGYLGGQLEDSEVYKSADKKLNSAGRDLYSAYRWCVNNLTYTRDGHGNTTSENAQYAYDTGIADCIGFASAFCYMARVLGYDCVVLHGEVPYASGGFGEHAWCEVIVGGKVYWVDTQFAKQTGRNGYLFNYGQSGTWMYRNWNVMSDF